MGIDSASKASSTATAATELLTKGPQSSCGVSDLRVALTGGIVIGAILEHASQLSGFSLVELVESSVRSCVDQVSGFIDHVSGFIDHVSGLIMPTLQRGHGSQESKAPPDGVPQFPPSHNSNSGYSSFSYPGQTQQGAVPVSVVPPPIIVMTATASVTLTPTQQSNLSTT